MGDDGGNDVSGRRLGPDRSCSCLIRYDSQRDYNAEHHGNGYRHDVNHEHYDDDRWQWIDDQHNGAYALGGAGASCQ